MYLFYVKGRFKEKRELPFTDGPSKNCCVQAGPGWFQEPGTLSQFPVLGPSPACPRSVSRSWVRSEGAETWSSTWMWCWCWRPGLTHCATVLALLSVLEHDGCPSGLKENSSRLQPFPKASSSLSTALLPSSLSLKRVFDSKSWTSGFGIWFGNVAHEVVGKCPSSVSWEALLPGLQRGCFPLLCWTH